MKIHGVLLRVGGDRMNLDFDTWPTLEQLQGFVGGFVSMLIVDPTGTKPCQMVVDEDGLLKKLDLNEEATALAGQPIVGDAILFDGIGVK